MLQQWFDSDAALARGLYDSGMQERVLCTNMKESTRKLLGVLDETTNELQGIHNVDFIIYGHLQE
jgi:hypothetical protein